MEYLEDIEPSRAEFGDLFDELPLWSAPFGLLLLDRAPIRSGVTILDVGAGTGFLTVELAQRCGPGARVIAVDPWKAGMNRLRRKLDYLGLRNVVLLEQDAATVDLAEASIDLVVSNLGINNFESVRGLLRDAGFRVQDLTTQSFRMRFADGSALLRHYFIPRGFVPGWKSVAAADSLPKVFETLERNLNVVAAQRGELALTIPIACVEASRV